MSGHRKIIRDLAKAALLGDADLAAMTHSDNQLRDVSADRLPMWTLYTRSQRSSDLDKEELRKDTELLILIRRAGGKDLQDVLDVDADKIEDLAFAALDASPAIFDVMPAQLAFEFSGDGSKRMGTAQISITCITHHDRPAL
jgi:hypothetical protein